MSRQPHNTNSRLRDSFPAKISAPRIGDWLRRERLFRLLDEARQRSRTIWVSAPAGAGKTYLIASYLADRGLPGLWYQVDEGDADAASFFYYLGIAAERAGWPGEALPLLTPEYLPGLATFARNFFRELFGRLDRPGTVVLDNYQDAPAEAALHDLLAIAVSELPEGLTLIIVTRGDVPASLARERVHGHLEELHERDLRLTHNEISSLARRYGVEQFDAGKLHALQAETHGWFAGVMLLLKRAKDSGEPDAGLGRNDQAVVFDYFATELFDHLESATREFLMRTAFLRPVTASAARDLTGDEQAETRLDWLVREHYFVVCIGNSPPAYRYHPLFGHFLRNRARAAWSAGELADVCHRAASQAVAAGYTEEAIGLLNESGNRDALAKLLCDEAPSLLAQGRNQSLANWLELLPGEYMGHAPWPRFWLAMARLYSSPREAREIFMDVYHCFRSSDDVPGQYMAWVGMVSSLLVGLDDFRSLDAWLVELDDLRKRHPEFPSSGIECETTAIAFCARVHRCEKYQDVEAWGVRALEMARQEGNLHLQVQILFYRGFHELVLRPSHHALETFQELEELSRPGTLRPIDRLRITLLHAVHHNCMLDHDRCRKAVENGLRIAEESGVLVLNVMLLGQLGWQAVQAGDARRAAETLQCMEQCLVTASPWDRALYYNLGSALKRLEGDLQEAESIRRCNLELLERLGESISENLGRFQMALIALEQGRLNEADELLQRVERFSAAMNAAHMRRHCCFARTLIALQQGNANEALTNLRQGFSVTSEMGRYGYLIWPPGLLTRVCETALRHDIEVDAVQAFIRAYGLMPASTSIDLEQWPWPVRIYTLGRFSLVVDGEPVRFAGKGRIRPLELLRALIAMGGRDVGIERLCEALWPDAEGDSATQSFKTTLHRLRRLVGESALEVTEGRLSLNAGYCWVDIWALERRLGSLEAFLEDTDADTDELESGTRDLFSLYHGPFLSGEADTPWALATRERLRNRLLQLTENVVRRLGREGKCRRARALCESGLQLHDHCEALYRGMMGCQAANGDRGAALRTYERCRDVLMTGLAIVPDSSTEALRRAIEDDLVSFDADSCPICGQEA